MFKVKQFVYGPNSKNKWIWFFVWSKGHWYLFCECSVNSSSKSDKKMFKLLSLWMKGIITNHKYRWKRCVYYFYTNLKHYGYIRHSSWFRQWKIIKLCYFKLHVRLFTSTVNINHTGKIWDTGRRNIFQWKTYIV